MNFANETKEDLLKQYSLHIAAASDEFIDNYLLLPETLTVILNIFFQKIDYARRDLGFALSSEFPSGPARAALFDKAATAAFQELPAILKAIEVEARSVIHGDEL